MWHWCTSSQWLVGGICFTVAGGCGGEHAERARETGRCADLAWCRQFGEGGEIFPEHLAIDAQSNTYVVGEVWGGVDFGAGRIVSPTGWGLFAAKFDADGRVLWNRLFSPAHWAGWSGIGIDSTGGAVVTGTFSRDLDLGNGPLSNGSVGGVFLAKLADDGALAWSKAFVAEFPPFAGSMAVSPRGPIFLSLESLSDPFDLGGGPLESKIAGMGGAIAKFDRDGNHVWSHSIDAYKLWIDGIQPDSKDGVMLAGGFDLCVDFGAGIISTDSGADAFIAAYDSQGDLTWVRSLGAKDGQRASALALDAQDNLTIAGRSSGTIDLGGGPAGLPYSSALFVARYGPEGGYLWSRVFVDETSIDNRAAAVLAAQSGRIVMAGHLVGNIDFGGGSLTSVGGEDSFLVAFDSGGQYLSAMRFGGPGLDTIGDAALDPSGAVVAAGTFEADALFGGTKLEAVGRYNMFLVKVSAPGLGMPQ